MRYTIIAFFVGLSCTFTVQLAFSQDTKYSDIEKSRRAATVEALLGSLKKASSESDGRYLEDKIWQLWMIGPNASATKELAAAMRERSSYNFEKALSMMDKLIADYPNFLEVRNQRAFVQFLSGNYDAALADLDYVIARKPKHFGALAGKGLALIKQGRAQLAQTALKAARDVNPWIRERYLIVD